MDSADTADEKASVDKALTEYIVRIVLMKNCSVLLMDRRNPLVLSLSDGNVVCVAIGVGCSCCLDV